VSTFGPQNGTNIGVAPALGSVLSACFRGCVGAGMCLWALKLSLPKR
jgi:hypothetical protein